MCKQPALTEAQVSISGTEGCGKRPVPRQGRKLNMPKRLPEKTKNAPSKPRRFGSKTRYRPSRPFVQQSRPVKENQEIEVSIADIGSRGDGIAKIEFPDFCSRKQDWRTYESANKISRRQVRPSGKDSLTERNDFEDQGTP